MLESRRSIPDPSPGAKSRLVDLGSSLTIHRLSGGRRYCLRYRPREAGEALSVARFWLGVAINGYRRAGCWSVARLGPDEWLVLGDDDGSGLEEDSTFEVPNERASLVDVSHRDVAFLVAGRHARDVMNGGCPLDLRDGAFPEGSATRTVFGKSEIVLIREGAGESYRIECARSFARYVRGLLLEGSRELAPPDP